MTRNSNAGQKPSLQMQVATQVQGQRGSQQILVISKTEDYWSRALDKDSSDWYRKTVSVLGWAH